jgi:iron complex outermembrane receptor protein
MTKSGTIRGVLLAGVGSAALLTAWPAMAQGQEAQRAVGIEEIVVTARKREERLQDVPLSITAFTETELQRRNVQGLYDVARFTPSLSFEDFNGTNESPVIRGQTQTRINNPVQNVATFMDGIYLQRAYMTDVGLLEMERVEVVKGPQSALYGRDSFAGAINYVTKKPNFEAYEGSASVTVGTDKRIDGKAAVGGPIIADKLAFRIGGGISKSDGSWKNNHPLADTEISGGTKGNLNGWNNKQFSITVGARPIENLSIEASWYHADLFQEARAAYTLAGVRGVALGLTVLPGTLNCSPTTLPPGSVFGAPAIPVTANTLWCGALPAVPDLGGGRPPVPTIDPRSFAQKGPVDIIRTQVRYEFTDEIAVQYLFGRALSDVNSAGQASDDALRGVPNIPGLPINFLVTRGHISFDSQPNGGYEMTSHEVRAEFSGERLQMLGGVYYSRSRDTYRAYAYQLLPNGTTPIENIPVGRTAIPNVQATDNFGGTTNKDEILGIFGSASYNVTDALRVAFEGRWTQEDKRLIDRPTLLGANVAARRFGLLGDRFRYFTPRATVDYKLTDENMLYATVAKGLKTGGFNGNQNRISDESQRLFLPETNWTYEIGSKNTFFDGRLQANLSVYYIDWKDMQLNETVRNPIPNIPLTVPAVILGNVGGATTWGVELEGLFQATDNLSINYGLSWNDPQFKSGVRLLEFQLTSLNLAGQTFPFCSPGLCPADGSVGGNTLPRTPKWKGVIGAQWQGDITDTLGYYVRGDVTYQSKAYLEGMNIGWVPSRTLFNASIGVTGENWDVQLWGRNLFDKKYASNSLFLGFSNSYVATLGDRRELGVTGTVKF